MRGKLVVFEGLDKAGKSTQCLRLVENLRHNGHEVQHIRFPDRTTVIGKMIDSYLKGELNQEDHVIHLLFSANRWELAPSIIAALEAGTTVVIDRYYYSGCVYSAAKDNPTLTLQWARHPEVGLPRPDVCIFLKISTHKAAERGGYGGERYESTKMQDRVRELFEELKRSPEKDDFETIDAGQPMAEVADDVLNAVLKAFNRVDSANAPLRFVEPW